MIKIKTQSILLSMVVLLVASGWAGAYSEGNGSLGNPYKIATAEDMNEIGANPDDWDAHFLLVADINLADYTGTQFNIIGNDSNVFTGVFDGNGHTISNFTYAITGTDYIGIFGYVDDPNAEIKDLTLIDPNVDAETSFYVGSLVGWLDRGTINGCGVEGGSVSGEGATGGLVGYMDDGTISNCCAAGSVSGNYYTGGLVGYMDDGTISDCYANGSVSRGDSCLGGLVGYMDDGTISNCYAAGAVSGGDYTGGLVGGNDHATISNCYATGSVEGDSVIGGLAGYNHGSISNCYATGGVSGNYEVGGLVGHNGESMILASFWDIETTGQSESAGGEGRTTAEMQTMSTFTEAGWDFVEIWNIGENQTYPYLRLYPAGDLNHSGSVDMFDFAIFASRWLDGTEP